MITGEWPNFCSITNCWANLHSIFLKERARDKVCLWKGLFHVSTNSVEQSNWTNIYITSYMDEFCLLKKRTLKWFLAYEARKQEYLVSGHVCLWSGGWEAPLCQLENYSFLENLFAPNNGTHKPHTIEWNMWILFVKFMYFSIVWELCTHYNICKQYYFSFFRVMLS